MTKYRCTNAFKENGITYYYGNKISENQFGSISLRNRQWFVKEVEEESVIPLNETDPILCGLFNLPITDTPSIYDSSPSADYSSNNSSDSYSSSSDTSSTDFGGGDGGGGGASGDW